jgi:hypothetical protein
MVGDSFVAGFDLDAVNAAVGSVVAAAAELRNVLRSTVIKLQIKAVCHQTDESGGERPF